MNHLTDAEFVDLLDGLLADARVAHIGRCDQCRDKADALRVSLAQVLGDEPHEPSPLFWDHFAARVSDTIRREPGDVEPVTWRNWLHHPGTRWAAAASVVVLLMVAAAWRATLHAPAPALAGLQAGTTAVSQKPDATGNGDTGDAARLAPDTTSGGVVADDLDADESWAVVRTVAEGVGWDEVRDAGVGVRPGSAERVALELTVDEREALARLLESEMKRSGA